jgi:hypothetical protein
LKLHFPLRTPPEGWACPLAVRCNHLTQYINPDCWQPRLRILDHLLLLNWDLLRSLIPVNLAPLKPPSTGARPAQTCSRH